LLTKPSDAAGWLSAEKTFIWHSLAENTANVIFTKRNFRLPLRNAGKAALHSGLLILSGTISHR